MSNSLMKRIKEGGLPKKWNGSKRSLYLHYADSYNDKEGKAWPGLEELIRVNGSKSTVLRYRRELVIEGFLTQLKRGWTGQRSEFKVNYPPIQNESVQRIGTSCSLGEGTVSSLDIGRLLSETKERLKSGARGSKRLDPKRINELNIKTKVDYQVERFGRIMEYIPESLTHLIIPGKNSETLLDELQMIGASPEDIGRHLRTLDWTQAKDPGGFFVYHLKTLKRHSVEFTYNGGN